MKCPALRESVLISLIIILLLVDTSQGDPRSEIIKLACSQKLQNNESMYIPNFEQTTEKISSQIKSTKSGTASTGSGPDSSYGLAECYDDLSMNDCMLCYAQAKKVLHMCLPSNGGRVFLDGCFMRTQNYNFYQEYEGVDYTVICGNTKRSRVFRDSVRQAISDVVRDAPRSRDYFARKQEISYAVANDSAYVLADCWNTLNESSCTECLESAFSSILKCFPSSEGRALHTGCFLRYSNTNFLNPEPTEIDNGEMNDKYLVVQPACGNKRATTKDFIPSFVNTMEIISTNIKKSNFGTTVDGTGSSLVYGLAQCYGDIPTSDCLVCYARGRTAIPSCFPHTGGRVYLNDCFLRYENYSFFEEYIGQEDRRVCPNDTQRNNAFEQSVRKAVAQAVETARKSYNYHARTQVLISGTEKEWVYVQADCWHTLAAGSCDKCLQKAAKSMLDCLPGSKGYALYTGCFMRYSDSSSSNPHRKRFPKGKILAIVMAVSSIVTFLVAFYAWKHKTESKRKGSGDTKLLHLLNNRSLNFKYSTIEKATNFFDEANKLGQGGFGTVYKGVLPNGREIAVKRLFFNHRHRAGDFYNEVNIIKAMAFLWVKNRSKMAALTWEKWCRFDVGD